MRIAIALLIAVLMGACSKEPKPQTQEAAPMPPSTAQTAIDGFTGRTAVKQGKKAQEQIKAISAQENKDLDEVLK